MPESQEINKAAIISHGLMLLNLLFPMIMYLVLMSYWLKHRRSADLLLRVAVNQAFIAATLSTALFLSANLIIVIWASYRSTFALITFEIYFIFVVPLFLIPGLLGLVKSNVNQVYYYPVLGRFFK